MFLNQLFPSSSWYLLCLSVHAACNVVSHYQCFQIPRNYSLHVTLCSVILLLIQSNQVSHFSFSALSYK